jgi:hypothetical protein
MAKKKMSPHLDKLIRGGLKQVEAQRAHWHKSDITKLVYQNEGLKKRLHQLDGMGNGYNFGGLVRTQIEGMVGAVMQERDAYGIRRYECYAAGERERRWQPLRGMTKDILLAVTRETRTQERVLQIKGAGYEMFIQALEQLGPEATVEDVYNEVAPKIMEKRLSA